VVEGAAAKPAHYRRAAARFQVALNVANLAHVQSHQPRRLDLCPPAITDVITFNRSLSFGVIPIRSSSIRSPSTRESGQSCMPRTGHYYPRLTPAEVTSSP